MVGQTTCSTDNIKQFKLNVKIQFSAFFSVLTKQVKTSAYVVCKKSMICETAGDACKESKPTALY